MDEIEIKLIKNENNNNEACLVKQGVNIILFVVHE
jgi:hypothetical protein